jgi:hypothetical protein
MSDDSSALLTVVYQSSLLELDEIGLGEFNKHCLHHVLLGESPGIHISVGDVAELRFLAIDYVVVSEESFCLQSVGQVVLFGLYSVVKNMCLNYLEADSYFTSLDEVHLLHLLAFFVDHIGIGSRREVPGH